MDGMEIRQLGYLRIGVSDVAAWRDFAVDVLGLAVAATADDGTLYLQEDHYHHRLIIEPDGPDDLLAIGWETIDDREMNRMRDRLDAMGVAVTPADPAAAKRYGVLDFIAVQDPMGIQHEIFYGPLKKAESDVPPGLAGKFQTGPLGMGHIAVFATGHDNYARFYSDVLGLRRASTRNIEGGAVEKTSTWRCNPRHHAVAIVGVRAPMPKRLTHFALHLNNIDDVGQVHEVAEERDLVEVSLGRHPSDNMLSFYMASPSGFQVEYGWDGKILSDDATVDSFVGKPSLWGHKPVRKKARSEETDMWRHATLKSASSE